MAASSGFQQSPGPPPLAMCAVLYQCITMAIKMASKYGVFFHHCVLLAILAATGAKQSKYLPDGSIQRLLM